MKRARHIIHLCLVSLTIALIAVHPAAACRLLRGRCCCCSYCCDPCAVIECPLPSKEAPPIAPPAPSEASPSDAPPGATTGAGQPHSPVATVEPTDLTVPQTTTTSQPPSPAANGPTLTFGEPAPPDPTLPSRSQAIVEPDVPAPSATAPRRTPAAATTTADDAVKAPDTASSAFAPAEHAAQPMPQTLRPRQSISSAGTGAPLAGAAATTGPATIPMPPMPPASRRTTEPPMHDNASPPAIGLRAVAPPITPPAAGPVAVPAFPKADDDPFAPAASRAPAAPANAPAPASDDPFAPLPPANPQPPAPLAAEPTTLKIVEALLPDPDGRLPIREWRDDSGKFQVKARLILILDGKVRLLKETGRTTTVPLSRLNPQDQAYISEIISRYGKDLSGLNKLAAR